MTYQADKYEDIRRRQEEIAAERNLALTGSTLGNDPGVITPSVGEYAHEWPLTAQDLTCWAPMMSVSDPETYREMYQKLADSYAYASAPVFELPDLRGRVKPAGP